MNYTSHYQKLIDRARDRVLLGYKERHHIVPRCIEGGDEKTNIVELTAEEHYVAHKLLVKIHPSVFGLALASMLMSRTCYGSKDYGWMRRRVSMLKTGTKSSDETRKKISKSLSGRVFSSDHKRKISEGLKGKIKSPEHILNMSASRIGKIASPETREKMRNADRKPMTIEHRHKLSLARSGQKPFLGKKHSSETIAKMRAYHERRRELSKGSEF